MGEWRETTLGDFASLQRGHDLPDSAREAGDIPVMGSFGVTGKHSVAKAQGPGVTVGRSGASIGVVSYIDGNYWPLNTCLYVTDFHGNNPRFAYYFLTTLNLASYNSGSAQPSLNRNFIHPISITVPKRPEQDNIVELLGALDDKIELNRQTNETLEALARAIFKDWFVDFGPTRAKAEGRPPYLAPQLWDLFPDVLDDEDKPVDWGFSEIGKEVKAVGGATPSTKQPAFWEAGEHNWATPKDLSKLPSPVLLRTDRQITDAGVAKISSGLLPVGTILLSSRAPIGYLAIAEAPTAVNQGFIAMVCDKRLTNLFVFFWCEQNLDYIEGIAGGSTFAEISKKVFRPIPVVVPENKCIIAFDEIVRPLYNKIVSNTKENETLAQTRDLLLPKLMSGEILLRDAEKLVEAVA